MGIVLLLRYSVGHSALVIVAGTSIGFIKYMDIKQSVWYIQHGFENCHGQRNSAHC